MAIIHRWPLIANANDSVGGLNLTNNGSVAFGSDGAIFDADAKWLGTTKTAPSELSLSCWFKWDSYAITYQIPFGFATNAGANDVGVWFDADTKMEMWASNGIHKNSSTGEFNSTNWPSTSHTLCVITLRAGNQDVYRGSTNIISNTAATLGAIDTNFSIGRYGAFAGYYSRCKILDFCMHNSYLSQNDVTALQAAGPLAAFGTSVKPKRPISPALLSTSIGLK